MRSFQTTPIRERDAQGHLTAAGLSWVETRYGIFAISAVIFVISAVPALICLWCIIAGAYRPAYIAAMICGALIWLSLSIASRWGSRDRTVIFHPDRIEAPHGLPRRPTPARLPIRVADTANIEAWSAARDAFPMLYTREGDSYLLGWALNEFQARKVIVQLTTARDELLASLAEPARAASSARQVIR